MDTQNKDDFKYVIQDMGSVYFGRELTYSEMMDMDDVPFKFKAVISAHIAKDTSLDTRMTDHILSIFEQLKLTVRICYREQKRCMGGRIKERWVHASCQIGQFCGDYRGRVNEGSVMIEDISISKLALMALSI